MNLISEICKFEKKREEAVIENTQIIFIKPFVRIEHRRILHENSTGV